MKRIIINNKIRHGKPIIEGTRITVDEVLGMLEAGMTYEEIYKEHRLTKEDILAVLKYISSLIKGEEIKKLSN